MTVKPKPKSRGRRGLFQEFAEELADDLKIRSMKDLKREIKEDLESGFKLSVGFKDALIEQIGKNLKEMKEDNLLLLALKGAEMVGDKSFLESWKILNKP